MTDRPQWSLAMENVATDALNESHGCLVYRPNLSKTKNFVCTWCVTMCVLCQKNKIFADARLFLITFVIIMATINPHRMREIVKKTRETNRKRSRETHSHCTHGQQQSYVDTPRKTLTVPISIIYAPFLSIFYPHTHACTIMDLRLFVHLCECVSLNGSIYGYSRCHKLYFVHTKHIRCCVKRLCKQISSVVC